MFKNKYYNKFMKKFNCEYTCIYVNKQRILLSKMQRMLVEMRMRYDDAYYAYLYDRFTSIDMRDIMYSNMYNMLVDEVLIVGRRFKTKHAKEKIGCVLRMMERQLLFNRARAARMNAWSNVDDVDRIVNRLCLIMSYECTLHHTRDVLRNTICRNTKVFRALLSWLLYNVTGYNMSEVVRVLEY